MEREFLEQATYWLQGSECVANLSAESRNKYTVAIAMAIHSIIKANDALTSKFLNTTAKRHDDARRLFEDLIKKSVIKPEYARYKQIIQDAITNKAEAEYRSAYFSKRDYEEMKRKAEKFLRMAETSV